MQRRAATWVGCAALVLAGLAAVPATADNVGADTCLDGYIWRGVVPTDHVCVTSATYQQVHRESDTAGDRHLPGSDLCIQGFIWREAVQGDHVCVLPASWRQAHDDNLAREARRNAVDITVATYRAPDPTCEDTDSCQTENSSVSRYAVRATRINVGTALVVLCKLGGRTNPGTSTKCRTSRDKLLDSWPVSVGPNPSGPGGRMRWWKTGWPKCPGPFNAYFRVRDPLSGSWSRTRRVTTLCNVL
jgi:hypothetical protein